MSETIRWERAEELLRALTALAERFNAEAQAVLPYGERRLAVRVEILPSEEPEPAKPQN